MARPLACGKQTFALTQLQRLAVGHESRGQQVKQALVWGSGVHVIQII
jgi:hypothetical protein